MEWVFAYGSNMDLDDLDRWHRWREQPKGTIARVEVAELPNWRLCWHYFSAVRQGGVANVEWSPGDTVYGLLLLVDNVQLQAIDRKEGHPARYLRQRARVLRADSTLGRVPVISPPERAGAPGTVPFIGETAWIYVVQSTYHRVEPTLPRQDYLGLMIRAAHRYEFPHWYIDQLESLPTLD